MTPSLRILTALIIAAGTLCAPPTAEARLQDTYVVDGDTGIPFLPFRVPEGVAFDPLGADFYATAIFGGRITRVDGHTGAEETIYQEPNPLLSFAGAAVAPFRRVLWMCAVDVATDPMFPVGQVYALDISQQPAAVIRTFDLPQPFFCNDVALDWAGNAYVTNSIGATVMRVPAAALDDPAAGAEPFATSPAFLPDFSIPGALGQNGVTITPDGRRMMVAISIPPALYSVSLADPTDIRPVQFIGGDAFSQNPDPAGDPLAFLAPDGLAFLGGRLYVSYHQGVQQLTFADCDYTQASVRSTTNVPVGVSTVTRARGRLYVIDSDVVQVTRPELGIPPTLPNGIARVRLRDFR